MLFLLMQNPTSACAPPIARIILYVKNIPKVAAFYQQIFGMTRIERTRDGWQVLVSPDGGCPIALFKAAVSQKSGAAMKLVFSVPDVQGFKRAAERKGAEFGPLHQAEHNGKPYEFANAKDPNGNAISISSRGISKGAS